MKMLLKYLQIIIAQNRTIFEKIPEVFPPCQTLMGKICKCFKGLKASVVATLTFYKEKIFFVLLAMSIVIIISILLAKKHPILLEKGKKLIALI